MKRRRGQRRFGTYCLAEPDSAALAAASASIGSDFPSLRRVCRFCRSTSTTTIPSRWRCRARPTPYDPVPSTPTRITEPSPTARTATTVAACVRRERFDPQHAAVLIDCRCDMHVGMRIHAANNPGYHRHDCPFLALRGGRGGTRHRDGGTDQPSCCYRAQPRLTARPGRATPTTSSQTNTPSRIWTPSRHVAQCYACVRMCQT